MSPSLTDTPPGKTVTVRPRSIILPTRLPPEPRITPHRLPLNGYSPFPANMKESRKRARQACIECNAKRIKCNVIEEFPCRTCADKELSCEVRESRRGKHARTQKGVSRRGRPDDHCNDLPRRQLAHRSKSPETLRNAQDVAASEALATLSQDRRTRAGNEPDDSALTLNSPGHVGDGGRQDEEQSVFLGESTSVRYVNNLTPSQTTETPRSVRLLHQVPATPSKTIDIIPKLESERRQGRILWLRSQGAFAFPEAEHLETLLQVYFQWFHPCFAIVDEPDIRHQVRQETISPLLLNAMLFVAVVHSEEESLVALGLESQAKAKYTFYHRAKDLYDADYEGHKLVVIQSLFLLSFWRAGPLLEKDARHWLATVVSLSQTKALHRSTTETDRGHQDLRKRLWWGIYVRERQCAAALGLPNRIRDEDCDLEPLTSKDFDRAFSDSVPPRLSSQYVAYQIGMADLSRFLGQIVHSGYLPGKRLTASRRDSLKEQLASWKQELPENMQLDHEAEHPALLHVCMLHLAYNNLLVLLHRSDYFDNDTNKAQDGRMSLQAASRTSRIIEDLLLEGNLRHAQIHVITNLFNALCIHTTHLRRSQGAVVSIAEHRAKICLLGLEELRKTWEMQNWILQLFFQYLDRSTAARLLAQADPSRVSELRRSRVASRQTSPGREVPDLTFAADGDWRAPLEPEISWPWSTEQQNDFLFAKIENSFAFGEGTAYDWTGDGVGVSLPQFEGPMGSMGPEDWLWQQSMEPPEETA